MGASLALAAFSTAAAIGLDGNPRAVLVRMALSALDGAQHPAYWAGWEPLAEAIGHVVPADDDTPEVARIRRAAREAVRTTVRRLTAAGVVSRAVRAAPGRNTRYALHLDATMQAQPAPINTATMQARPGNDAGSARSTMQAQPAPEEETGETEKETRATAPPALDPRCPRHRGVAHPPPCVACRDARLAAEVSAAAEADADRARRAAALATLDPSAVEALSRRLGGRYSDAAIIEAARAEMPGNLPLGLRVLAGRADAAEAVARWER
jgi:hypothetical protein